MWSDRELEEENVYDLNKPLENGGYASIPLPRGDPNHLDGGGRGGDPSGPSGGGIGSEGSYQQQQTTSVVSSSSSSQSPPLQPPPSCSLGPMADSSSSPPLGGPLTGNGDGSCLDYHSAPTMDLRLDHGLGHPYDHRHDLMGYSSAELNGAHETSMLMMLPPPTPLMEEHHRNMASTSTAAGSSHHPHHLRNDDVKLPTAKERHNYLKKYAHKFGLNDRGCYIACGLAILAFFLFIIVVAMGASWPGRIITTCLEHGKKQKKGKRTD